MSDSKERPAGTHEIIIYPLAKYHMPDGTVELQHRDKPPPEGWDPRFGSVEYLTK